MSRIVIVDLDGTLCSINTFRWWMLMTMAYLFFSLRWLSFARLQKIVILRLLRKLDRVQMKRSILELTEKLPSALITWFCRFLYLFTNQNVLSEMRRYDGTETEVVLCTAAPSCYVETFALKFGFSRVIATPSVFDADWKEMFGVRKLEMLDLSFGTDYSLDCVITDHYDDLPLMLKAKRCLLVKPSGKTLGKIAGLVNFDVI